MIDKLIELSINNQIDNNMAELELLNIQLGFYSKMLSNSKSKKEIKKYQNKIDNIACKMNERINFIISNTNIQDE